MINIVLTIPSPRFPLGQIVVTANAASRLDPIAINGGLRRHATGDWGNVDQDDANQNEVALEHGCRLLSVYGSGEDRFWIITESDRSLTTVLMPEDY
jgi:hypothetical protein